MKEPGSIPSWGGTVATSAAPGELYVCLGSQTTLASEGGWDFDVCLDLSNPCAFSLMYVHSQYSWEAPEHLGRALPGGREFELVPTQMGTFPIVWKSREGKLGPTPPPFSGMPEPCDSVGGEEVSVTLTVHVVEACRTWEAGGAERKRRLAQATWTKAKGGRGGCDPPPSWPDGPAVIWPPVDDPNECDISTVNCEGVLEYRTNGELIGECCFLNGRNSFYVKPLKSLCEPRRRTGEVVHIVQTSGTCDSLGRYKFRIGRKDLTTGWKAEYSVYSPVPSVTQVGNTFITNGRFEVDRLLEQPAIPEGREEYISCTGTNINPN